jgi:hypothetical protein
MRRRTGGAALSTPPATTYVRNKGRVRQVGPPLPLMHSSLPGNVCTSKPARLSRSFVLEFSSRASKRRPPKAKTLHASVSRSAVSISINEKPRACRSSRVSTASQGRSTIAVLSSNKLMSDIRCKQADGPGPCGNGAAMTSTPFGLSTSRIRSIPAAFVR